MLSICVRLTSTIITIQGAATAIITTTTPPLPSAANFQTPQVAVLERSRAAPPLQTRFDRWLLIGLLTLLCFGPLAFGAVEPWAIFLQELGAATLASAWLVRAVIDRNISFHPNPLYGPLFATGLLFMVQLALRVPAYQHAFLSAVLSATAYLLLFLVANQAFKNPAGVQITARIFIIFGATVALYSILQSFAEPERLLGFRSTRPIGTAFGPYVNHNHYAGLMEMLAPFALVLALRTNLSLQKRLIYSAAGGVIAGSIFLSQSRGGMVAFAAQVAILAILALASVRRHKAKIQIALAVLAVIGLAAFAFSRISINNSEISFALRKRIAADSLRMTAVRPWLGWGLGNFAVVYPQFRSFYTNQAVRAAHNDYLQWLSENGIVGAVFGLWFLFLLYRCSRRHFARWKASSASSAKLAAVLGIMGIAIHGLGDFNLHIPANAALFFTLCAMATVKSRTESSSRSGFLGVTALIAVALLALLATRGFVGDRFSTRADLADLRRAVHLDSLNADNWHLLATYEADPNSALHDLRQATALNSHDAAAWLALANAAESLGDVGSARSAISEALRVDPRTPIYLFGAANLYLSMGEQQPALRLLQDLAANDPESLPENVALAWRATRDPKTVLTQVLPGNVAGRLLLLNFLAHNNDAAPAEVVWHSLASEPVSFPRGSVSPYVDFLLQQSRGRAAKEVWQRVASDANGTTRTRNDNLITNASFEQQILNAGFGWRYEPSTGVTVVQRSGGAHSGNHSLEISFSGAVDAVKVWQFVAVQPGTHYEFTGFSKATDFEGASEVVFSIVDAKSGAELARSAPIGTSHDWSAFSSNFSESSDHDLVILKLVPTAAGKQMRGQIWLDDLSLKPNATIGSK